MLLPGSLRRVLMTLAVLGLVLPSPVRAQTPARTVHNTVSLSADGAVTLHNHEGSITVTTWDRDQVRYEAEIMPTDEDPEAEKTTIQVRSSDDRLRLATEHEEGDDESTVFGFDENGFRWGGINIPAVHYTVQMPRTAALTIEDHESTIEVTGLAGRLRIDNHDGTITVSEQRGDLSIDSHEGRIVVTDHRGDVTLDTHEGRMELRRVTGRLSVDTHDGELVAEGLKGGLRFEAHDGSARVSFAEFTDSVFADTHDGDVTLTLPAGTGFELDADLEEDANLLSDFAVQPLRTVDEEEIHYRGPVNGGGPGIHLDTNEGAFTLRSK